MRTRHSLKKVICVRTKLSSPTPFARKLTLSINRVDTSRRDSKRAGRKVRRILPGARIED